jgi:hypothetical protein
MAFGQVVIAEQMAGKKEGQLPINTNFHEFRSAV